MGDVCVLEDGVSDCKLDTHVYFVIVFGFHMKRGLYWTNVDRNDPHLTTFNADVISQNW
jgi:hypothetical protein